MAWARLASQGIRVIAMSRFGYPRDPMPADAPSTPPLPPWVEGAMMRVIGSDFLFWAELHCARRQVVKLVLAAPPELLAGASPQARASARP